MSHCVTFHQNVFLSLWYTGMPFFYVLLACCSWFLISVLHHGGLKFKLPWTEKSTVSGIIWHLNYCFHKNRAALSVARIGLKCTHSVKTAQQIPLTETLRTCQRMCCSPFCDWTGSVLLFHRTQKMVFPWVVACNQVHVFSWPLISASQSSQRDQESSVRKDFHQSLLILVIISTLQERERCWKSS